MFLSLWHISFRMASVLVFLSNSSGYLSNNSDSCPPLHLTQWSSTILGCKLYQWCRVGLWAGSSAQDRSMGLTQHGVTIGANY